MSFVHPVYLLILWCLPVIGAAVLWRRRRHLNSVDRFAGQRNRAAGGSGRFIAQLVLWLAGIGLLLIAAARPQWGMRPMPVYTANRNVLVLLDVSRSMLSEDIRPSRLERARADLLDLVDALEGDRCGVMAFRDGARMICPFTTDTAFVRQVLETVSIDAAPRGETDIGKALETALTAFQKQGGDHHAILLLSDGEDLTGHGAEIARKCAQQKIPVFCVGVGSREGGSVPADEEGTPLQYRGEAVVSKLNPASLITIANLSGGVYLPIESTSSGGDTLGTIYRNHVRRIVQHELEEQTEERKIERFGWFLGPGLLLLFVAAALSTGRPRRRAKAASVATATAGSQGAAALAVLLSFGCCSLFAQDPSAEILSTPVALPPAAAAAPDSPAPAASLPAPGAVSAPAAASEPLPDGPDARRQLARQAQKSSPLDALRLYRAALAAPDDGNAELLDTIRINAGLAALAADQPNAALELFRAAVPSSASQEGIGLACYRLGKDDAVLAAATNAAMRATALDRKADHMSRAAASFRDAMQDAALTPARAALLETNLVSAAALAKSYREGAQEARLAARIENKAPAELLQMLSEDTRKAYALAAPAFTNALEKRIAPLESAAGLQRRAAELWPALNQALMTQIQQATTNLDSVAEWKNTLTKAADQSENAIGALENLLPESLGALRESEAVAFAFQQMLADPLQLLDQAIECQSNALSRVSDIRKIRTPFQEQLGAFGAYDLFSQRLQPWLDQQAALPQTEAEQPQPGQLTPEQRAELQRLCDETTGTYQLMQMSMTPGADLLPETQLPNAEQSAANLCAIRDLLRPPRQNRQNQQNQQQQQNQNQQNQQNQQQQDSSSQDQQNQNQNQNQDQQEQQDESDANEDSQQQDSSQEEQAEPESTQPEDEAEETPEPADETSDPDQEEADALLQAVLDQERDRADAKRRRQMMHAPRLDVRDW